MKKWFFITAIMEKSDNFSFVEYVSEEEIKNTEGMKKVFTDSGPAIQIFELTDEGEKKLREDLGYKVMNE